MKSESLLDLLENNRFWKEYLYTNTYEKIKLYLTQPEIIVDKCKEFRIIYII